MANKSQRGKKDKKKKPDKGKERKKAERAVSESVKFARGQKRTINKKKHRGKHYKGTRKGQGK